MDRLLRRLCGGMIMTEEACSSRAPAHGAAGAPFHVSLFVTHRLTPDGAQRQGRRLPERPRLDGPAASGQSTADAGGDAPAGESSTIPVTPLTGRARARPVAARVPERPHRSGRGRCPTTRRRRGSRLPRTACRPTDCSRTRRRWPPSPTARAGVDNNLFTASWCCGLGMDRASCLSRRGRPRRGQGPRHHQAARRSGQGILGRGVGADSASGGARAAARRPARGSPLLAAHRGRAPSIRSGRCRAPCRRRSRSPTPTSTSAPACSVICRRCCASSGSSSTSTSTMSPPSPGRVDPGRRGGA